MPSPSNNTARWKELSEVDYFGLFVKNWLAFNSWYKGHHPNLQTDRDCVDAVKNTLDPRNSTFTIFRRLITSSGRDTASLLDSLDGFATSLNRITLTSDNAYYIGQLSFSNALTDRQNNIYEDLIRQPNQRDKIKLGVVWATDNIEALFKGVMELEYQVRCLLFHGRLEPTEENHQVIKYAYLTLRSIMNEL